MIKLKSNIAFYLLLYFILSVIPFFLAQNTAIAYSLYNYAIAQFLIFKVLFSLKGDARNSFFLSPSFIAVSYININFLIGRFSSLDKFGSSCRTSIAVFLAETRI